MSRITLTDDSSFKCVENGQVNSEFAESYSGDHVEPISFEEKSDNDSKEESPDQQSCENDNFQPDPQQRKRFLVKFSNEISIKPPTILRTEEFRMDTLQREEEKILQLTTKEEVIAYSEQLINELDEYEQKEGKGYDKMALKEEYDNLQYKFDLLNQVKQKIIKGEQSDTDTENENDDHKTEDYISVDTNEESLFKKQIYEYINNIHKGYDVLIVLHCCVLKEDPNRYLMELEKFLKKNRSTRIAFYYFTSAYKYKSSNFIDKSTIKLLNYKEKQCENVEDIRNDYVSMSWNRNTLRVVCNVISMQCKHNYENICKLAKNELIDPVKELIDYNKIFNYTYLLKNDISTNEHYFVTDSCIISELNEIFFQKNFNQMIKNIHTNNVLIEELFNLKRVKCNSFDEFLKYMKKTKNNEQNTRIDRLHTINANMYTLEIDNYNNAHNIEMKDLDCNLEHIYNLKIVNYQYAVSKCNAIYEAHFNDVAQPLYFIKYHVKQITDQCNEEKVWLETFQDNDTYFKLIEIHQITSYYAEIFNDKMQRYCLKVANSCIFKAFDQMMFGNFTGISLNEENKKIGLNTSQLIQAFMHFTYIYSNKSIMIIDLRTFEKEDNTFFITEPIILSKDMKNFGLSNLGPFVINEFIGLHKCNKFCEKINLINND